MRHRPLSGAELRLLREACRFASGELYEAERAAARSRREAGNRAVRRLDAADLVRAALFGAVEQIIDVCSRALDHGEAPDLRVVPDGECGGSADPSPAS